MTTETFEAQALIKLESSVILPTAFPTRLWTGAGPLLLDVGDGNGTANWVGTDFGNIQTIGIEGVEKTSEGVPKRLAVAVGIDESRADAIGAILGADHGPLTTTVYGIVREAAGASLPQVQRTGLSKVAGTATLDAVNEVQSVSATEFRLTLPTSLRDEVGNLAVEGNTFIIDTPNPTERSESDIAAASVATGLDFDTWTVYVEVDSDGTVTRGARSEPTTVVFADPFKSQDWAFIQDRRGAPLVIRGRTGRMEFKGGIWSFEVENRVHDANRLLVDIWSDSVQQANYSGDRFFEFAADIAAGQDFSWPN